MIEYLARVMRESIRRYREELREDYGAGEGPLRFPLTDQYGSNQPVLDN